MGLVLVVAWAVAGTYSLRDREARQLGIVALVGAALGGALVGAGGFGDHRGLTAGLAVRLFATVAGFQLMAVSAHFLVALPRGKLLGAARRRAIAAGYVAALLAALVVWAETGHLTALVGACSWAIAIAAALPAASRRYVRAVGRDRQRLQWLGCGAAAAVEFALVSAMLHVFVRFPGSIGALVAAGTVLVPLALAATSGSNLVGRADRLLVFLVSATGLTVIVAAGYLIIVLGLGGSPDAAERSVLGLSMVAAAVTAIISLAARQRLKELARRLVYGKVEAPDEVLRTFASRLTRAIPTDELLLQAAESLRRTMALAAAEIWTGGSDILALAVSSPDRRPARLFVGERERPIIARAGVSGNAWVSVWLPGLIDGRKGVQLRVSSITYAGELLGLIVLERPAADDTFTIDDDRILTELARQVGQALHNVQLNSALHTTLDEVRRQAGELRASRTRVVAAADAERRRIERNLHDGAQQHLVALAVNLMLIKDSLGDDPAGAVEMVNAMAVDVKETIRDLRDLAHGIYPPLLLDGGLGEALRAAADHSPLDVRVSTEGVGRYEPDIEAAVYFCCLEALQNSAKHAPGAVVEVRVLEESDGLIFEVGDDGPGFASPAGRGHGFVNMSDRIGAIGGTIRWEPNAGSGALVIGAVPLAAPKAGI